MRNLLALALLIGSACGGAAASTEGEPVPAEIAGTNADQQRIVLHRAHAAGERFEVMLRGTQESQEVLTVDGEVARRDIKQLDIVLLASVVIHEVNARGKATRSEYTVQRCTTAAEPPVEILPAGSVLTVTAVEGEGEGEITLAGGELSDEQKARIGLVVSTHISGVNDHDVFGTDELRAVGESWQVNSAVAAADLSKIPNMEFEAEHITGRTTFVALEDVDGVPCQRLTAELTARDYALSGLPEGSVIEGASLGMQMSGALPLDASLPRLRSEERMTMQMIVALPAEEGHRAVMTVDHRQLKTVERRPLPTE